MIRTIEKLALPPLALALAGCIMTMDEPELDPIVGKWVAKDWDSCVDTEMIVDEDMEGIARLYFELVNDDCAYWEFDVRVTAKGGDDYDIDFDYEVAWNVNEDEECSVEFWDIEFDCDLDGSDLDCKGEVDIGGDLDIEWEKE